MKITGELLKSERIKKDLKVQDVAYALKLNSRIITALEEGDLENLPSKTFIRGFVKSYAEYLKLDANSVLKQFQEEMGSTHPVPRSPPPMPEGAAPAPEKTSPPIEQAIQKEYSSGFNQKNSLIFIGVAVAVLGIAGLNQIINKYQKETISANSQQINEQKNVIHSADVTGANTIGLATVPSSTDNSALQSVSGDNTVAGPNSQDTTNSAKAEKVNEFPPLETSSGKPVEVLIEAKKDIAVEYAKGASQIFQKISIKKNSFQVIRSNAGLHLRVSDGAGAQLTINGVSKGSAGTNDKPVQLSF